MASVKLASQRAVMKNRAAQLDSRVKIEEHRQRLQNLRVQAKQLRNPPRKS